MHVGRLAAQQCDNRLQRVRTALGCGQSCWAQREGDRVPVARKQWIKLEHVSTDTAVCQQHKRRHARRILSWRCCLHDLLVERESTRPRVLRSNDRMRKSLRQTQRL